MTTMTDKLLAKAAEYEEKAKALRFAAGEMNGDALNGKQKVAGSQLQAAIALRKGQRAGQKASSNGHVHVGAGHARATTQDREATIRAFLKAAEGPQNIKAIQAELEARDQGCSGSWALKMMREMKDVHLIGYGNRAVWSLGKKPRAKPGSRLQEKRAARALTARVLEHYDREKPTSPREVAKALGLTVPQTGFAPLVHQGYLKPKGKDGGYIRTAKTYVVETPAAVSE